MYHVKHNMFPSITSFMLKLDWQLINGFSSKFTSFVSKPLPCNIYLVFISFSFINLKVSKSYDIENKQYELNKNNTRDLKDFIIDSKYDYIAYLSYITKSCAFESFGISTWVKSEWNTMSIFWTWTVVSSLKVEMKCFFA